MEKKEIQKQTYEITCIYDRKSGTYMGLNSVLNNAVALRAFADACQDEKSMLNKHAEDYDLVNLGKYEIETGKIIPLNLPLVLGNASQFINNKK